MGKFTEVEALFCVHSDNKQRFGLTGTTG